MLELRHRHVELSHHHAQLWLACMAKTMVNLHLNAVLQSQLQNRFSAMIKAMQQQRISIEKKSAK